MRCYFDTTQCERLLHRGGGRSAPAGFLGRVGGLGRPGQGWWGLKLELCAASAPPPQDGSGYIDENELDALLKDLYEKNKKVS